ncbi:MAG: TIGR03905 family TSCPD domain-containing protein [Victivallaceae bacterium]|nr:TIGR03905 family TSCPD domain-containing protein [Victivallaceae bacterium]
MIYRYQPQGVCSREMEIELSPDNQTIQSLKIIGGCPGNTQGISRLVAGMKIDDVIAKLDGIRCGGKPTSCPDQLARALKAIREKL